MQLHNLKRAHFNKNRKRIGRGGKRGKTSGRGQKGQKSRSGHRLKNQERRLIQRLPKLRGATNPINSMKVKSQIVDLDDLNKKVSGDIINRESLLKADLIRNQPGPIKILSDGKIDRPVSVQKLLVSKVAEQKIIKAGGKVIR